MSHRVTEPIRIDRDGGVVTITLQRPEAHNALTLELFEENPVARTCLGSDDFREAMKAWGQDRCGEYHGR